MSGAISAFRRRRSILVSLALPLLRLLPAETAHGVTLSLLKAGLAPAQRPIRNAMLASRHWGLDFPNPVGLAAGFDKNGEVSDAMLSQGFGFVEIGSVTPRPQPGNPKPRLFRLSGDQAVINRMGFNNHGLEAAAANLASRTSRGVLGANLGKNKDTEDAAADYVLGVETLGPLADYLVINVSSPNTPGLRALQGRAPLEALIGRVQEAVAKLPAPKPLLLKIAPDLTPDDRRDIAEVALETKLDGLIVSNTTIERPASLTSASAKETGGLSGAPLFAPSTALLGEMYQLTKGRVLLVGVGGIGSGKQAYAKIRAGASLLQLYSALVYQGPALVNEINLDLIRLMKKDGFSHLGDAVGANHR
ncbi:MAG TPA: quinone-dependent dihydroorotate dehydrogenase [Magnetospirillaceae bacterium]|nr:quinone-dependent dihydroorotate dehydrogenase [Magnetospirillaceae bacterium]